MKYLPHTAWMALAFVGGLGAAAIAAPAPTPAPAPAPRQLAPQNAPPGPPGPRFNQPPPPPGPQGGPGRFRGDAQFAAERAARIEARLAFVKTRLGITEAQTVAWNAYAAAVRQQAEGRNQPPAPPPQNAGPPTLVDRLAETQQRLAQASARATQLLNAVRPLYASLNDDQKRIADRMLRERRGEGRMAFGPPPPRGGDPRRGPMEGPRFRGGPGGL